MRQAWPKPAPRKRPSTAGAEEHGREIVATRSGGRCERCGQFGTTVHHRRKRSQGGRWDASNLLALCGDGVRGCHGWAEANPSAAHEAGYWLRHGEQSTATPVLRLGRLVLLDDDGQVHELPAPLGGVA
ncbi:HNH endonuclease [Nocardia farcinica]|uniref:HNH endonuclease n=1 Tax=Nocardia farcinica TaxID=37329 RepID=UPI003D7AE5B0